MTYYIHWKEKSSRRFIACYKCPKSSTWLLKDLQGEQVFKYFLWRWKGDSGGATSFDKVSSFASSFPFCMFCMIIIWYAFFGNIFGQFMLAWIQESVFYYKRKIWNALSTLWLHIYFRCFDILKYFLRLSDFCS